MSQRPPYMTIGLLSAGALSLEIVLMRLFAIIQWHHFAYLVIGLALLGYGVSGSVISIAGKRLARNYTLVLILCAVLFAISAMFSFRATQAIPFNPEELLWGTGAIWHLAGIFLVLTLPFLFAASAVCLTFQRFRQRIPGIYAADLIGAGVGSSAVIMLLYALFPQRALAVVSLSGVAAALTAAFETGLNKKGWFVTVGAVVITLLLVIGIPLELKLSPYKEMVQMLRIDGTEIIHQRSSPFGLLSVLQSRDIPLRHAPGLSLSSRREPLAQIGVFTDGGSLTAITRFPEDTTALSYLDQMTSAAAYHFQTPGRVLVAGAGGGADLLQAVYQGVPRIDAVELNPQVADLVGDTFAEFSGDLYSRDDISLHIGEVRDYLTKIRHHYNLIQVSLLDGFLATSSGLHALQENYLYTVEALALFLKRLETEGYLSITRWVRLPPRDAIKLLSIAIESLRSTGVTDPENRIVLIRSWQTSTLIVKRGVFTADEKTVLQKFCNERSFDIAYMPGMKEKMANRYNILAEPVFYQAARSLLGVDAKDFMRRYKFYVQPSTDDRPYFFHFFKWRTLTEILRLRGQGGLSLMEWGYPVLIASLAIAIAAALFLILLPLCFLPPTDGRSAGNLSRKRLFLIFFVIGLAFLMMEIAFIQKFILFLKHPVFASAATLTAFLIFAGIGSRISAKLSRGRSVKFIMSIAVTGICILSALYLVILDDLFITFAAAPMAARMVMAVLFAAPLAFFMGFPFPLALSAISGSHDHYLSWAWGINGCASVIGASLATLLAVHFGFTFVVVVSMACYAIALWATPALSVDSRRQSHPAPANSN